MTADVRTFRAANMQAALDIVRREMGQDAVILHTRQIDRRRLLFFSKNEVEVTAGIGAPTRGARTIAASPAALKVSKSTEASAETELAPPPPLLGGRSASTSVTVKEVEEAGGLVSGGHRNTVVPPKWSPNDVIVDLPAIPNARRTLVTPPTAARPTTASSPPARSKPPVAKPVAVSNTIAARARVAASGAGSSPPVLAQSVEPRPVAVAISAETQAIGQRLDTLQRMILELGKDRTRSTLSDIPTELFPSYTQLLDNDVDELLARELVCQARDHASRGQLRMPQALQSVLSGLIEQEFRIGSPIKVQRGQRKVVALVGPTGVGKTTTLAKLAANLRLREGLTVGLITVDTYRIAAVEQLKTYAELIELPMKVVTTPSEMRQALDELRGLDIVLIDTAGRSPRDELKIQELKDCLDAAQADEVHLVLSLASGMATLESVSMKFQSVGITSLILTKLDEATGTGLLLQAARQLRTPVSYLTTGQNVPDDIEPAQKGRMARLVLSLERIS